MSDPRRVGGADSPLNHEGTKDTKKSVLAERAGQAREHVARSVVDAALQVHRALGPGLLESVYEECLAYELESRGIAAQKQVPCPVVYREVRLQSAFRIDLVVGGLVAVELKAVERLLPLHDAQLLTYMKLAGYGVGLLINFNVPLLKDGLRRLVL